MHTEPLSPSAVPQICDIVVVMNGEKERANGRPAYERAVLLDRTTFGGWNVLGFTDLTTNKLRADIVTAMRSCLKQAQFLRVPSEAVCVEDVKMLLHFERMNMINARKEEIRAKIAAAGVVAGVHNPTSSSIPSSSGAGIHITANANASANAAMDKKKRAVSLMVMTAAAQAYAKFSNHTIESTIASAASNKSGNMENVESLYLLADYTCTYGNNLTTEGSSSNTDNIKDAPIAVINSTTATSTAAGVSTNDLADFSDCSIGKTRLARSTFASVVRLTGHNQTSTNNSSQATTTSNSNSSSSVSTGCDQVGNMTFFTSRKYGQNMNDIFPSTCFVLAQELVLFSLVLQEAKHRCKAMFDKDREILKAAQAVGTTATNAPTADASVTISISASSGATSVPSSISVAHVAPEAPANFSVNMREVNNQNKKEKVGEQEEEEEEEDDGAAAALAEYKKLTAREQNEAPNSPRDTGESTKSKRVFFLFPYLLLQGLNILF